MNIKMKWSKKETKEKEHKDTYGPKHLTDMLHTMYHRTSSMEPVPLIHRTVDHHKQHVFAVTTTNTSCWQRPYIVHRTKNILNFAVYLEVIQEILTATVSQKLPIKQQDSKQQRSMPEEKQDLLHRRKMQHYQITLRM